jgi:hypothetical protein
MKDKTVTCGECAVVIKGQIQFHECDPGLKRITEIGKRVRARAQRYEQMSKTFQPGETHLARRAADIGMILSEIADAIEGVK